MNENTLEKILIEIKDLKELLNKLRTKQKTQVNENEWLNSNEASLYLDISKSYFYQLTMNKAIPYYKPNGKKMYFKKIDLDNLLNISKQPSIKETKFRMPKIVNTNDKIILNNSQIAKTLNITKDELKSFKINYKNVYLEKLPKPNSNGIYSEKHYNYIIECYNKFIKGNK